MDMWRHLGHSMKIKWQALYDDQTLRYDVASSGHSISNQTNVT